MLPLVGFTITLMQLRVLMAVTASLRSRNCYSAFERMLCLFPNKRISIVFTIGFIVPVVLITCLVVVCYCSQPCPFRVLVSSNTWWTNFLHPRLPYRVSTTSPNTTWGILCWTCFSSSRLMVGSPPASWKSTWPRSHCLVIFLLIYSVTRKACMILHDASSGTVVHGVSLILWHHCHPGDIVILLWLTRLLQNFASIYFLLLEPFTLVWCRIHLLPWWIWKCTSSGERSRYLYAGPCRWSPARTRSSRVEVFLKTVHILMGHSWHINGETMIPFRPISVRFSRSSV